MAGFIAQSLPLHVLAWLLPVPVSLFLWRFWTFIARPKIWPSEPRTMPYWLPFVGHFYSFFFDSYQLIDDSVKYFGKTGEPFAFQLCGVKVYCLSRPEDVTNVLDGSPWTHGLDFSPFALEAMKKYGMSLEDVRRADYIPQPGDSCYIEGNDINPQHLSLTRFVQELYKQQFLDVKNLAAITNISFRSIEEALDINNLEFCSVDCNLDATTFEADVHGPRRTVRLFPLVSVTMVEATVRSLFGPYLHQFDQDIVNQIIQFKPQSWMVFYGMPDFGGFTPVCKPRDRIRAALRAFIRLSEHERSEQCFAFKTILKLMEVLDFSEESRVAFLFLIFFASIASEQNQCYWLTAHVVHDVQLLHLVREEMEPAWESGKLDVNYLMSNCLKLDAIFNETLRQRATGFGWRVVKEKTTIRGKELQPGVPVMIPLHALHGNEKAWGPTVDMFDPSRFLRKKTLARQPFYRPFSGGRTHCPGRVLARQDTYVFLANLLHKFDVSLLPPAGGFFHRKQAFPFMETGTPPTGVNGPVPDMDLYIELEAK